MAVTPIEGEHGATGLVAITKSDTAVIQPTTRGIYVGVSADLAVTMLDGTSETLVNLAAGVIHALQVTQVLSTGTTATGIKAVY